MSRAESIGVMHVVDSLSFGGTEKVAVTLAGALPRDVYRPYLCSTRELGPLAATVPKDVPLLALKRTGRFDLGAVRRFLRYVRQEQIKLLHVHSSSLFFAKLACLVAPDLDLRIVWHDHFGSCEFGQRNPLPYRLAIGGTGGVIAVNGLLADWARQALRVPSDRVWYLRNFVNPAKRSAARMIELPGSAGNRIVCVANLRQQKDHLTLLRAMKLVCARRPSAHLLLIGAPVEEAYAKSIAQAVEEIGLSGNVSFLGSQDDVFSHLVQCDIGVLSSASEGLPLSLLEYGSAALPVVATRVGQCAEVLDHGRVGLLVEPGSPQPLAEALLQLLEDEAKRHGFGTKLNDFVTAEYSRDSVISALCGIYSKILNAENKSSKRSPRKSFAA